MDANFNTLLNRYIENQATPADERQLMLLIAEGAHQWQLEQCIDSVIRENVEHPMTAEEVHEVRASILRRSHPGSTRRRIITMAVSFLAAAACLMIALVFGVWLYDGHVSSEQDTRRAADNVFIGKGFYFLPDSSTIILNDESELSYNYTRQRREVTLVGEAYFQVNHDPRRPFYVRTGKLLTKVLGTSFSVRAYPRQKDYMVAVTEGLVQVSDDDERRSYGVLSPDEQLSVNPKTEAVIKTARKDPPVLEWRKGFLILNDATLKEAAALIYDSYGATLKFKNPELEKCEVNAKFFNDEKLTTVLDVITSALGLTYTIEDGEILIDGKGCF